MYWFVEIPALSIVIPSAKYLFCCFDIALCIRFGASKINTVNTILLENEFRGKDVFEHWHFKVLQKIVCMHKKPLENKAYQVQQYQWKTYFDNFLKKETISWCVLFFFWDLQYRFYKLFTKWYQESVVLHCFK